MPIDQLPKDIRESYEIHEWKHASAILQTDFPGEWSEIIRVLSNVRVRRSHVLVGGGGRSKITQSIDSAFYSRGWEEQKSESTIAVAEGAAGRLSCQASVPRLP